MTFYYWHALHPKIKWIAMDYNGAWYGYETPPSRMEGDFWSHQSLVWEELSCLNPAIFPDLPWEDSLIERPKS